MAKDKGKAAASAQQKAQPPTSSLPGYVKAAKGGVNISVHAKPGAKMCGVSISQDVVDISIDEPARDGEANAGLVEYLASVLGVRKASVSLAIGGKSREKVFFVEGLSPEAAVEKLQQAARA